MYKYVAGLDLGVAQDFSALAIMRRDIATDDEGEILKNHRGRTLYEFRCVHIERYHLGMSYTSIVDSVKDIMGRPELHPPGVSGGPNDMKDRPRLAIDATGVGRAVVDMFVAAGMPCRITPVTITGGLSEPRNQRWNADGGPMAWWTPKIHLVSTVQATLQGRRLKVSPKLKQAELLKKELFNFQVKVTAAANETFNARDGVHDDLVLAAALAIWLGAEDFVRNYATSGAIEVPKAPKVIAGMPGKLNEQVDPHVEWNRMGPTSKRDGTADAGMMLDTAFRREKTIRKFYGK